MATASARSSAASSTSSTPSVATKWTSRFLRTSTLRFTVRTVRTSPSATPSAAAAAARTSPPPSGSPASSGNFTFDTSSTIDRLLHQALGGSATRQHAASPRPMQVVAAAGRVHVQRLAHHVQARHRARRARARIERLHRESAAPHLALPRLADASDLERESFERCRERRGIALPERPFGAQPGRLQHAATHRRQHHAAQHVVARARSSAREQARSAL